MRVLWILNFVLPKVASEMKLKTSFSGGWLIDYAEKLSQDPNVELATMTYAKVDKFYDVTVDNIRNFIFPGGGKRLLFSSKKTIDDCQKVIDEFNPDLIHIHGTEYSMGYSMIKTDTKTPKLLTIQGILKRISREYKGGLPAAEFYTKATLKQLIHFNSPFFAERLFIKNAKRERFVLESVSHVTGRTLWDKAVMQSINPNLKYYRLNYNLRPEFYVDKKWDYEAMTPHTIYTGAATYSLKGLHILIKALEIVRRRYPDVKLYIPGNSMTYKKSNGYERYIRKMINRLGLTENVEFVGRKKAEEVIDILTKVNVCVVPSAMEGASATLCEAMMVGTPSICTFRGGMTDLLRDGESGFYYDFPEYGVLAERICDLFEDRELCEKFSEKTKIDANKRHDREKNYSELVRIYEEVVKNN